MSDNRFLSVSGIVIRENKILLVRQAYGAAKGLLIIPGGYLTEGEMPNEALEREILEETGIRASTNNLIAIRFSRKDWWAIFTADYISGEPITDGNENSEALFLDIDRTLLRDDLTYTTKEILKNYKSEYNFSLSDFCPNGIEPKNYQLYI
jgi:ADP-ribose pyrophosphatase YjhB (NUDIX family)